MKVITGKCNRQLWHETHSINRINVLIKVSLAIIVLLLVRLLFHLPHHGNDDIVIRWIVLYLRLWREGGEGISWGHSEDTAVICAGVERREAKRWSFSGLLWWKYIILWIIIVLKRFYWFLWRCWLVTREIHAEIVCWDKRNMKRSYSAILLPG